MQAIGVEPYNCVETSPPIFLYYSAELRGSVSASMGTHFVELAKIADQ